MTRPFGFSGAYYEITNRCNLNCATCYNRSGLNRQTQEATMEQLTGAVCTLVRYGARRISFAGGEPLLHSGLAEILGLIRQYPDTAFAFVTNGTVHDERFIEHYYESPNMEIQVSLDGSCEQVNALSRGRENFSKTRTFMDKLKRDKRPRLARMTVSRNNLSDVEAFYRSVVSWGFIPDFSFANRIGNAEANWERMAVTAQEKAAVLRLLMRLNEEHKLGVSLPFISSHCPLAEDYDGMLNLIKPDGTIQPCQLIYDGRFSLGNIYDIDLDAFLRRCDKLGKLVTARFSADYGCGRCIVRNRCKGGCMAHAINLCGDPLGDDGECEYRRLQYLVHDLKDYRKPVTADA